MKEENKRLKNIERLYFEGKGFESLEDEELEDIEKHFYEFVDKIKEIKCQRKYKNDME